MSVDVASSATPRSRLSSSPPGRKAEERPGERAERDRRTRHTLSRIQSAATGSVVSHPTERVGDGPTSLTIPSGSTQLQLGVDDDKYSDNIGAWTIQVTASPSAASTQTVSGSPLTLSFNAPEGLNPLPQTIQVSGTTTGLAFTATPSSTGNWLSVSEVSGPTPASINVLVYSLGLGVGTFTGTILVAGAGGIGGQTIINVTLTVTSPLPNILKITNDASYSSGPIAPGEMLAIFGTNIGPTTGVAQAPNQNSGQLSASLGGVEVFFPCDCRRSGTDRIRQ